MDITSYKKRIALVIARSGGGSLKTLTRLEQDLDAIQQGLLMIGFYSEEIIEIKNQDNSYLDEEVGKNQFQILQETSN